MHSAGGRSAERGIAGDGECLVHADIMTHRFRRQREVCWSDRLILSTGATGDCSRHFGHRGRYCVAATPARP